VSVLKVTDEIREAARRLLERHNAAETERVEDRYRLRLADAERLAKQIGRTANKAAVRALADHEHPTDKALRRRFEAIVNGKRKQIDAGWWREVYGDVDRAKIDKLTALADEKRNDNEHERRVAAAKLAAAKARRPPGMRPRPEPLPKSSSEWLQKRKAKTRPRPSPSPTPMQKLPASTSDSVARKPTSIAAKPVSDSAARLHGLNVERMAKRAAARAGLTCQRCGKPLAARRPTARFCGPTCRSQAWRQTPRRPRAATQRAQGRPIRGRVMGSGVEGLLRPSMSRARRPIYPDYADRHI
jgi:hypothetical protein